MRRDGVREYVEGLQVNCTGGGRSLKKKLLGIVNTLKEGVHIYWRQILPSV